MKGPDSIQSNGTPASFWISAGHTLVAQFLVTTASSLLAIGSLQAPESWCARLVARFDHLIGPVMRLILGAVGAPPCSKVDLKIVHWYNVYVQLILIDLIIVGGCFGLCAPFWKAWARQLRRHPYWLHERPGELKTEFMAVSILLAFVATGAVWLLIADDPFGFGESCQVVTPWLLLRVPLLTTISYGFACLAAAFGLAAKSHD